jgi:hypothetical protein
MSGTPENAVIINLEEKSWFSHCVHACQILFLSSIYGGKKIILPQEF